MLLNWSPQSRIPGALTTGLPRLTQFGDKVYACWSGVHELNGYYSVYDGANWLPNQMPIPGVQSQTGPAVVTFNNLLYFFWTTQIDQGNFGVHNNVVNYQTFDGGSTWGDVQTVRNLKTGDWVSVAVFGGELFIAFRGAAGFQDDANHWMKMSSAGEWSQPAPMKGGASNVGPSLAVFENKLFAAWQGVGNDDGIWWSTYPDGADWANQQNIPGVGTSVMPALAALPDRLCAAWHGIKNDDGIYASYFRGDGPWAQPQQNIAGSGSVLGPGLTSYKNQVIAAWQGDPNDPTVWWSTVTPA